MAIKSLPQTLKDLATGIKNAITGVTGSNATLTIIKGNGTTSTVTVNNVANAGAATKATQDSAGQQINSTYIKGLSVSGKTITYTKGDNTTGTITTQDTVYTHPNSGVTAGTYKSVTVNAQGHVTAGSNPTTLAGYGITDASLKGHTHSQYLTASSDLNVNKLKGVISLDNLPAGALERLVKVTNDTARFALTTNDIQLGDTVKVESTKMMYIVKDITKLNSEDGYEQYTAGMASSVPWSGVTGKPSSYTPSAHTHDDRYYTESEINSKVNTINSSIGTKADKNHTHDDRYYTESEIDSKLSTKSPLIGSTSLSKLSSNVTFGGGGAFSITQNDGSWWQRLRTVDASDKTQKRLIYEESQGNSGSSYTELFSVDGNGNAYAGGTLLSKNGHTHDDRYYTESEMNTKLAGKSDTSHTHDDRYYTESEINTKLSSKSDTSHTHNYLPLAGGTTTGKVNMKSANLGNLPQIFRTDGVNFAGIRFQNTNGYLGAIGITGNINSALQRLGANGTLYPILDSSNYNNYSPTKTGGGASGTWGISISGKANTAGTADKVYGGYSGNGGQQGPAYFGKQYAGFLMSNANVNSDTSYKNWLYMDNYGGNDAGGVTAFGVSRVAPRAFLMQSDANRSSWNNYAELLSTYNYNTYAPKKDGTGASGTWGINISGKANTAGTADTSKACSGNSATATKATQDSAGQQINTTYIKGLSVSGKTITYTKGNGTTGTITTQDTIYTHPNSGVTAGTYKNVTVNAQGHVTGGSNPTTLAGYGITDGVFKYALGSTADKSVYTMFASCQADAGSGNISATVLLTQGGNFGGAYQGAWLIQISTRGGKYMSVKTLRSASSGPIFGYYVSGSTCYFGAFFPAYRGDCNVTVLSSTGCTLKDFGDITTAPSGWTTVTPELILDSGNYNSYVPTKTGGGASGTWGINITGNAASATTANTAKVISGFAGIDNGTWGHSTGTYITGFQEKGGGSIQWRAEGGRLYERVDGTFWQREGTYEVIDTSTVNNYAPTKTGSGASGTWGISISGKANTAGTADTSKACSGNSATSTKLNSRGRQTAITAREEAGMYTHTVYNNGYPVPYGNVITVGGDGGGQLLLEWSGADKGIGHVFYRNRRDCIDSWSDWRMLALTTDNVASATKLATARNFKVNLASTGAASFNGTSDATPGVTGTLSIANGGTGATTAAAARSNLGITCANIGAASASHTHSYVPLTGGKITGQISKQNISTSWVTGRNIAPFRTIAASSPGDGQYVPVLSAKTYQGSWDIGPYTSNILHFSYITDANFNAGNNTQTADIQFHTNGTVVSQNFSGAFNGISMKKDSNGNIVFS